MREELFMAGTGGQGVLLAGQVLAQAVMEKDLNVSWFPIYSPEVRGGTTTCTLVITDGLLGSPITGHPTTMLLMDGRAVDQHLARIAPQGLAVVNMTLAPRLPSLPDVKIVTIPATDIAITLGSERTANMVMLGAYVALHPVVEIDELAAALDVLLPERHRKYLQLNVRALQAGADAAQQAT